MLSSKRGIIDSKNQIPERKGHFDGTSQQLLQKAGEGSASTP